MRPCLRDGWLVSLAVCAACQRSSSSDSTSFLAPGVNDLGPFHVFFALKDGVLAEQFYENGVDQNGDGDRFDELLQVTELASGRRTILDNIGYGFPTVGGGFVAYSLSEDLEGRDLDGDGDTLDFVMQVRDVRAGSTRNLGVVAFREIAQDGAVFAFMVWEASQAADLDGNGDRDGAVPCVYEADRGRLTLLPVAGFAESLRIAGRHVVYVADEREAGDLDHDGDTLDAVPQVYDLDDGELHDTERVCTSVHLGGAQAALLVQEQENGGGDLNGNGRNDDAFVELRDLDTGLTRTTSLHESDVHGVGGGLAVLHLESPGHPWPFLWVYDFASDTLSSLQSVSSSFSRGVQASDRRVAFLERELDLGYDADGDGDEEDRLLQIFDGRTGVVTNTLTAALSEPEIDARRVVFLGPAARGVPAPVPPTSLHVYDLRTSGARDLDLLTLDFEIVGERILAVTPEAWAGVDLDSDDDLIDYVLQVYDLRTGRSLNTRLDVGSPYLPRGQFVVDGDVLAIESGGRLMAVRLR